MANRLNKIFLLLSCLQFIFFCAGQTYIMKVERIETSGKTGGYFKFDDISISKQKGDANAITISGKSELRKDMGKSQQVSLVVSKLKDGKYVELFHIPRIDACKFMETIYKQFIHPKVSKCSNLPDPGVCPIPSGQYEINDCPADLGEFDRIGDTLGPGNYTTGLTFLSDDQEFGYITIYTSIVKNPESA